MNKRNLFYIGVILALILTSCRGGEATQAQPTQAQLEFVAANATVVPPTESATSVPSATRASTNTAAPATTTGVSNTATPLPQTALTVELDPRFIETRGEAQIPRECKETGMCSFSTDIPAPGFTSVSGSPMAFLGESRIYDASKRQAQVWVFINSGVNVGDPVVSLTMKAWSGSNNIHSFNASEPVAYQVVEDAALADLAQRMKDLTLTSKGNCTTEGCDPKLVGYVVWVCSGNDNCEVLYSWNPAQNLSDVSRLAPNHDKIIEFVTK